MPAKVIDLEFTNLPEEILELSDYQWVLILLRYRGLPVSKFSIPVQSDRLRKEELLAGIVKYAGQEIRSRWLRDFIGYEEKPHPGSVPRPATIAICTRDRADDLKRCLEALHQLPDNGQEILVIDSASSNGATRQVVESYPDVRYHREDIPGLDRARNDALRLSQRDIIAFIDDDAVPDPGWLEALTKNFFGPRVLSVTGLTMPIELVTVAQECFEIFSPFSRGFNRQVFTRGNLHPLAAGHVGAGVNMAFRRNVLSVIGPFDERLDAGTPTQSGGDTEMFSRILAAGYTIIYEPAALNWHRHRRTWLELRRAFHGYGVGVYAFWSQKLLEERQFSVPYFALEWIFLDQLPNLMRALLRKRGTKTLDLMLAEIAGCVAGPWAFIQSRKQQNALSSE